MHFAATLLLSLTALLPGATLDAVAAPGVRLARADIWRRVAPAQDPIKTSFEVLAGFDYAAGQPLPAKVTALDSKVVTISGFMLREVPGGGPVGQFLLINSACGCNGSPKLNEIVFCALPDGVTMDVQAGIVHVTGTLYVGEQQEEGEVVALYVLDADEVK